MDLRGNWDRLTPQLTLPERKANGRRRKVSAVRSSMLSSALKSCKRIFDVPCRICDGPAGEKAKEEWAEKISVRHPYVTQKWSYDHLWELRRHVRELSAGWGERLQAARKECEVASLLPRRGVYVPDQQGCLEQQTYFGGTLSVSPEKACVENSLVRLGVAKTKGKLRVVTMQSARVKRVLTPVHNALYDHLSDFGWLVRGDVKKEDFQSVVDDVRPGEFLISGDYSSATDNITLEAVETIVDVLCEEGRLEDEERKVLWESFRNLEWVSTLCSKRRPIRRGSMMGNLVSFPLLCLLNKACFDIASDIHRGSGQRRIGRFNGDDCAFAGSREFFSFWKEVTSAYGLVVNTEKTDISPTRVELNSQPFFVASGLVCPKPVLSFFRPSREDSGDLLSEVIRGVEALRNDVKAYVLNVLMRFQISLRKIVLSTLPRSAYGALIRRSWFKRALGVGPAPVRVVGTERNIPVVVGPPPRSCLYPVVDSLSRDVSLDFRDQWVGVTLPQGTARRTLDWSLHRQLTRNFTKNTSPYFIRKVYRGSKKWSFSWPERVWDFFLRFHEDGYDVFLDDDARRAEWVDDHPFLSVSRTVEFGGRTLLGLSSPSFRNLPPPSSLSPCGPANMGYS